MKIINIKNFLRLFLQIELPAVLDLICALLYCILLKKANKPKLQSAKPPIYVDEL